MSCHTPYHVPVYRHFLIALSDSDTLRNGGNQQNHHANFASLSDVKTFLDKVKEPADEQNVYRTELSAYDSHISGILATCSSMSAISSGPEVYEEDYNADPVIIENDGWYTTREEVRDAGTTGHRERNDIVIYENGLETERTDTVLFQ